MQNTTLTALSTLTMHTGRKIPMIGYGTYQLRGQDCLNGVKAALLAGYTHIDTASVYQNQAEIKIALQESGVSRQKLFITSKIGPKQQGKHEAREAVENIIKNLNCKHLNLVLIHWPGAASYKPEDIENQHKRAETWNTLIELQSEGKVKDIGVSNFLKHHLQHLRSVSAVVPAVNQFELHPLLWETQTINYCRQHNIIIEAYSPLARQDDKLFKNALMTELSIKYKKTVAQISLRWCLQNGFVALPKSKTAQRIKQNIDLYEFQISQSDMDRISALKQQNVRTCWNPHSIIH